MRSTGKARGAGAVAVAVAALCAACTSGGSGSAASTPARTTIVATGGAAFGVAATPDGRFAFVTVLGGGSTGSVGVDVVRLSGPGAPALVRSIPVAGQPLGETITPNGKYLLAADGNGAVVISVARAESGAAGAVLGMLAAPGRTAPGVMPGSAIEVATSPDGRYAFVTLEYDRLAVVFNLAAAVTSGFGSADYVGSIPLGQAAVGMAVSPGGRWLYATSEIGLPSQHPAGTAAPAGPGPGSARAGRLARDGIEPGEPPGTLTVIDLRRAETDPAASVVATVDAGCQPVRVITSGDGTQVWVTARASDELLCFSAARLVSDPARALVAEVRVGEAPVGLAAVRGGTLIVVADSDRFAAHGAHADLAVVSVAAALAGRSAVVGRLPAGRFPRDMALTPNGTLLVSDFSSGQLESVDTATLPVSP